MKLYALFLAPVISYMAKHGITDLYQAHQTLTAGMITHYMKFPNGASVCSRTSLPTV
jgi:hypothetical protein